MKNKLSIVLVLIVLMTLILGCGISERIQKAVEGDAKPTKSTDSTTKSVDDKSMTDKAIDSVVDGESTGVPECDEVIALIDKQTQNPDDDWMSKAAKGFALGQVKKGIKQAIEDNKNDTKNLASTCKDAKIQVEKAIASTPDKK